MAVLGLRRGPMQKALADGVRAYVPGRYKMLGIDGFRRSDCRRRLRSLFEVDRYHVVVAVLKALAEEQQLRVQKVTDAIVNSGIDAEGPNPSQSPCERRMSGVGGTTSTTPVVMGTATE